jgi:hypothetical protein
VFHRFALVASLTALVAVSSQAEEGMWLLDQITDIGLESKGLKIPASEIWDHTTPSLAQAVVNLGATGELVSPNGLLLTNHHVAYLAIQRASTGGTNYLSQGFVAMSNDEEIPAPGYSARIVLDMRDVTTEVLAGAEGIDDLMQRQRAIESTIKSITDRAEKGREDYEASVKEMYGGLRYVLFVHQRFDDVRLVYAPPSSIGNFGGDIDNWMWPRHTGDFSFMRIWAAPDGSGRVFNPENLPYKPKRWLRIAAKPLREGDFTLILGYPGRTTRYKTSYAIDFALNTYYPRSIANAQELIDLLDGFAKRSPELAIKVAGFDKALNNRMKNFQGNLEGMARTRLLDQRRQQETEIAMFINLNPARRERFGDLFGEYAGEYDELRKYYKLDEALGRFELAAGVLAGLATDVYTTVREREKPETERDPLFSEKDVQQRIRQHGYRFMTYDEEVDKAALALTLKRIDELPEEQRIAAFNDAADAHGGLGPWIDSIYASTMLDEPEKALALFDKSSAELDALGDPMIDLLRLLYPAWEEKRIRGEASEARLAALDRRLFTVLREWHAGALYPDANSSLRLTFGKVSGYEPRDAVIYKPFTTLAGVIAKDTGRAPFAVPPALKELARHDGGRWSDQILGDVPVAFLSESDITGGNSGSPVLNERGELVGIAFDGNWEALTSDWQYEPDFQRTISVDIRYVLYLTERMARATYLLEEMGIR